MFAKNAYEGFRASTDDIAKISTNTGWDVDDITQIKNHIFLDELRLDDAVERLAPDYEMAQAWKRLVNGEFYENDILLLKHELYESTLYHINDAKGIMQREAHDLANEVFNWQGYMNSLY